MSEHELLIAEKRDDQEQEEKRTQIHDLRTECEGLRKAASKMFDSHCLNAMHRQDQFCPVCVDYYRALASSQPPKEDR
jgi:hypothetical protein